jgi:NhaP-type Na+/H+ or K+/H+ antiporter
MAIFLTKYATAVTLAIQPQSRHNALFSLAVCALFGAFNGYFLGRLARNLQSWQQLRAPGGYLSAAA